jgi:type IV pilus assembly protein PilC
MCQRVGMALRAGLPMKKVWEGETRRGSGKQRQVMQAILDQIGTGDTVGEAFRSTQGYFPRLVIAMIEIGERTGKLEAVFLKLGEHYEHQLQMQRQFLFGIAWPGIQLFAAVMLVGLLIYIFGVVGDVTGAEPIDITGLGLTGASGVVQYFFWITMIVLYTWGMIFALIRGWFGTAPLWLAARVPLIGTCFTQMAMARLTWSLGMALDAGIDAGRSAELAIDSTQNPFYHSLGGRVLESIAAHRTFHESFRDAEGFPDDFLDLLEAAEESGTLSESLVRMSRNYDEQAQLSMLILTRVATGLVWAAVVIMLVVMIMRVASIYLGALNQALEGL